MQLLFSEISNLIEGEASITRDAFVNTYAADSRTISKNFKDVCFFALKGSQTDGHIYVQQLAEKGAQNFVVEDASFVPEGANYILVQNALEALQLLAAAVRKKSKARVIAITGSNGKTITKDALVHLFAKSKFKVVASPRSYNSQLGVALSLLKLQKDTDLAFIEAGISKPGEMNKLREMINPNVGILTHLGDAHQNSFRNTEEKVREKMLLFTNCSAVIANANNPCIDLVNKYIKNTQAIDISNDLLESIGTNRSDIELNNLNLAYYFAKKEGLTSEDLIKLLLSWKPPSNRISLIEAQNNSVIIDDSYTNDMAALQGAIMFTNRNAQGKKLKAIVTALEEEQGGLQIVDALTAHNFSEIVTIGKGFAQPSYNNVVELLKNINNHDFSNCAILVKGLHKYQLKEVVQFLKVQKNVTRLQISSDRLKNNYKEYESLLSKDTKVLLMLKAEAYGSGIQRWVQLIKELKPNYIGVAHVDEGVQLRQMGLKIPVLVLYSRPEDLNSIAAFDLQPLVYNIEFLRSLLDYKSDTISFHLEIDTGMHRLGFYNEQLIPHMQQIKNSRHHCVGVMSHLSSSDDHTKDDITNEQIQSFKDIAVVIEDNLESTIIKHIANTASILRFPKSHLNMVRLGIGVFGVNDSSKNVFTWKTEIAQVKTVAANEGIGYGSLEAKQEERDIAILPVGYADGFDRGLGNGEWRVMINDVMCPTVGNICMDMCMIDVTHLSCAAGDEVILMGPKNDTQKMALVLKTIPYEVISRIAPRVNREYVSE